MNSFNYHFASAASSSSKCARFERGKLNRWGPKNKAIKDKSVTLLYRRRKNYRKRKKLSHKAQTCKKRERGKKTDEQRWNLEMSLAEDSNCILAYMCFSSFNGHIKRNHKPFEFVTGSFKCYFSWN